MKILHTSDWHLGHQIYGYDRTEEQLSMIDQVVAVVERERPDLFLLSGDVYHTATPSAAVQTLFTDAMVRIHMANPTMTMVVTAGNHDSGSKHDIFKSAWNFMNVHTIGSLDKDHLEGHIVEVPGKGFVVAMPYVYERNLPEDVFQQLLDMVAERNVDNLPVVMSAHTTVRGCDYAGHDHASEYSVGGIDTFDLESMGVGYDYLALGHIHHEQFVHSGRYNVRYSGTPLAVSFDECYPHSVSMVEIEAHGCSPTVTTVEIENPRPLVTLPEEGAVSWDEAKALLEAYPADVPSYVRLNVLVEDYLPTTANADAVALTRDKRCRFCHINVKRTERERAEVKVMTVQEVQEEAPVEIAKRFAEDSGLVFDDDMAQLFADAMRLAQESC